jgi:galactose-1-phosphate uridylyltransferase
MSDKYYIDASSFLEVTSELADYIMQEKLGDKYDNYEDESGVINYTKAGQDMFNNYVEVIEGYLSSVNIVHEDQLQEGV